jgi:hypothetical protein
MIIYKKAKQKIAIVFFFVFLFCAFLPVKALSAEKNLAPKFNPICWEKKACEEERAKYVGESGAKAAEGWLENQIPCDQKGWGMCLPTNVTKAQVSFGGSDKFTNIGEYIKTVYNYSLIMISIIAVVVIIIAGAQWISSAGNSEMIKQSQKRITGAIIGLFIAFMSFNILQSINPATINLRLPQVYMVRQQVLAGKWCRETATLYPETEFAFGAGVKDQSSKIKATNENYYNMKYPFNEPQKDTFWCGQRFFVGDASAETTCLGDRCKLGEMCTDADPQDKNNPYMCRKASVSGEIYTSDLYTFEKWEMPWVEQGKMSLIVVCGPSPYVGTNRFFPEVVSDNVMISQKSNDRLSYLIMVKNEDMEKAQKKCGSQIMGFLLEVYFNRNWNTIDEAHIIGKNGVDLGCSDYDEQECGVQLPDVGKDLGLPGIRNPLDFKTLYNIKAKHYIYLQALQAGIEVNIDMHKVYRFHEGISVTTVDYGKWNYAEVLTEVQ